MFCEANRPANSPAQGVESRAWGANLPAQGSIGLRHARGLQHVERPTQQRRRVRVPPLRMSSRLTVPNGKQRTSKTAVTKKGLNISTCSIRSAEPHRRTLRGEFTGAGRGRMSLGGDFTGAGGGLMSLGGEFTGAG
eukprot:1185301-Prorocentrum_minimum.AAC.2